MLRVCSVMYLQNVWERPTGKSAEEEATVATDSSTGHTAVISTEQEEQTVTDDITENEPNDTIHTGNRAEGSLLNSDEPTHEQPLVINSGKTSSICESVASQLSNVTNNSVNESEKTPTRTSTVTGSSSNIHTDFRIGKSILTSSIHTDLPEAPIMSFDDNTTGISKMTMPKLQVTEGQAETDRNPKGYNQDDTASLKEEEGTTAGLNSRLSKELPMSPSSISLTYKTSTSKLSTSAQKMINRAKSSIINEKTVKDLGRRTSLILEKINLHLNHHSQNEQLNFRNSIGRGRGSSSSNSSSNSNNSGMPLNFPSTFDVGSDSGSKEDLYILPPVSSAASAATCNTQAIPYTTSLKGIRRQSSKLADKSKALSKKLKRAISFHQIQALHA